MNEHKHSPARMRYSKFVHYVQNYRQTPHRCCCLLAAKIPRPYPRSTVPLDHGSRQILLMRAASILIGAPRNCSRFVCWTRYGFHGDVLDSVYVPRLLVQLLLYSDTVRGPDDNSIRLGRTDASIQNSTTTNARSMSYRYTGAMLYQALCGVQRVQGPGLVTIR